MKKQKRIEVKQETQSIEKEENLGKKLIKMEMKKNKKPKGTCRRKFI